MASLKEQLVFTSNPRNAGYRKKYFSLSLKSVSFQMSKLANSEGISESKNVTFCVFVP